MNERKRTEVTRYISRGFSFNPLGPSKTLSEIRSLASAARELEVGKKRLIPTRHITATLRHLCEENVVIKGQRIEPNGVTTLYSLRSK